MFKKVIFPFDKIERKIRNSAFIVETFILASIFIKNFNLQALIQKCKFSCTSKNSLIIKLLLTEN